MKKSIIIICALFVLLSCKRENEYFRLNDLSEDTESWLYELYVMTAPSSNLDTLAKDIASFVRKNSFDKVANKQYYGMFYRETWNTPRDYEEDHSFIGDIIADHLNDLIGVVKKERGEWSVEVKIRNNPDEWKRYFVTDSLTIIFNRDPFGN